MIAYDLPAQPTAFVGRTHELSEIARLLDNPDCRLLTLVGPGGMGKTRLSLAIASLYANRLINPSEEIIQTPTTAFPDGVYFVPLQPLNSLEFMVSAIAEVIGLRFYSGDDPQQQLFDYLLSKTVLLILDNFEHLLDGANVIAQLLSNAPNIKVLITSRETLNLQEEWLYQVKGMRFPETNDAASPESYTAVQFFVQNARRAQTDFSFVENQQSVLRICQLVDGMPLALEMTAAWLKRLPADEIAQQIERGLDILENPARNVPPRHRSIRAVFEHSWELLTNTEQAVFAKLSVFRGGFRREAAESVAGATLGLLSSLIDKSLLRIDNTGRYDIHELLRQYAEEKLNVSVETTQYTQQAHCRYYMDFLAQREGAMVAHMSSTAIAEIGIELKNIRSATTWAIADGTIGQYYESITCLTFFYQFRCLFEEGEEVSERIVAKLRAYPTTALMGRTLIMQGWFIQLQSKDMTKAKTLFDEALQIAHDFSSKDFCEDALLRLSDAAVQSGDLESAKRYAQESLELRIRKDWEGHWSHTFELAQLGNVKFLLGDFQAAKALLQEATASAREFDVPTGIADGQNYLGQVELALETYQDAKRTFVENLAYTKQVTYLKGIVLALIGAGEATYKLREYDESRRYLGEALKTAMESNQIPYVLHALTVTAEFLMQIGASESACTALAVVLDHRAIAHDIKVRASQLYATLEAQVAPEIIAAAGECAACNPLEKIIHELLNGPLSEQPPQPTQVNTNNAPAPLTERELEIIRLLAEGLSNREIAEKLFLATGTVKWYLSEVYGKLYVTSRTQAIARARALTLID